MLLRSLSDFLLWPRIALRGVGQIMFQNNAWTGLIFLLGIAVASPLDAAGTLLGAITGLAAAIVQGYDRKEIADGLYGFNAALVGLAAYVFLQPVLVTHLLLVAGCVLSAVVTWFAQRYLRFPTYTGPFVVVTWLLLGTAHLLQIPRVTAAGADPDALDFWKAITEGVAEVMLQANVYTGLLFLLAIAVSDWRHALCALGGSLVGCLVAVYHSDAAGNITIGLFGYNGALAAIALYLYRPSLVYPLLGVLLSVPIAEFFPRLGLETLTAPFVLATWLTIALAVLEKLFIDRKSP